MIDTDALRKLLAEATQGTWTGDYDEDNILMVEKPDGKNHWYIGRITEETPEREDSKMNANFELIVAAVNALPTLLDRLDRLEAFVRDVNEGRIGCGSMSNCGVEMACAELGES